MANVREPPEATAAHGRRNRIALLCSVCGNRNYKSTKSPRDGAIISLSKFCSHCNQHTVHIEGK